MKIFFAPGLDGFWVICPSGCFVAARMTSSLLRERENQIPRHPLHYRRRPGLRAGTHNPWRQFF